MLLISRRNLFGLFGLAALVRAADAQLIQPAALAARLGRSAPPIFQVGFEPLFHGAHIPGSVYAGPGSKPEILLAAVAGIPKNREIVLYCGCCPWEHCPNIRPAGEALAAKGYTKVRLLNIPTNLKTDWIDKGYPVTKG